VASRAPWHRGEAKAAVPRPLVLSQGRVTTPARASPAGPRCGATSETGCVGWTSDRRRAEGHVLSSFTLLLCLHQPRCAVDELPSLPCFSAGESTALPGAVHNQGCSALCEVSLRQGCKKLVTAPCLANRFGGPMTLMLLGTSSYGFKHSCTRRSHCRAAFLLIAFLIPLHRKGHPLNVVLDQPET